MAEFKDRLREAMTNAGINQSELAQKTGITQSSVSDWLKGKYLAKQDKVDLLAKALNVSPSWLMGIDSEKETQTSSRNYVPETIAAHFEGKEFTDEDLDDIARFIDFIASKKRGGS